MLFDLIGTLIPASQPARRTGLHEAGRYTLWLAALGCFPAVISGLALSHGQIWGRGNLGRHHLFLWPGYGLLLTLAIWRLVVGSRASHLAFKCYIAAAIATAGLMSAAGYWGGELLLNG